MSESRAAQRPDRYAGDVGPCVDWEDFDHWMNCWANVGFEVGASREWREGYQQAVRDIRGEFLRLQKVADG